MSFLPLQRQAGFTYVGKLLFLKMKIKYYSKDSFFWLCKGGLKTNFLFPHRVYLKMQPDSRIEHRYQDQLQKISEMHRTISENKPHHTGCIKPGTVRFQGVRWNLEMPLQERKGFCEQEGAPGYLAPYGTPGTASSPTPYLCALLVLPGNATEPCSAEFGNTGITQEDKHPPSSLEKCRAHMHQALVQPNPLSRKLNLPNEIFLSQHQEPMFPPAPFNGHCLNCG